MRKDPITIEDLRGVFPVPPLARKPDARRAIDFVESGRIVKHITAGGPTRLLYGGNAFLYHITLKEYEELLDWLTGLADNLWCIPSAGPSYGRAMDQAPLLARRGFPCAMMLPCADPRDAAGLERGLRDISDAAGMPLIVYLKEEHNFGSDLEAGLDVVGRMVEDGLCVGIKYAVVRKDPAADNYLAGLLKRVPREKVISGIGERPAVIHMRDWGLPGFTTGSGCVAPGPSQAVFDACVAKDYGTAEAIREKFLPLEDLRDAWGPAKVLHHSMELAGIAKTGPLPPFHSGLQSLQLQQLEPVARQLVKQAVQLSTAR
ncbi:MAG: dihydrodipicolinate synthase family protein [Bryobacteraceae bacterium]